MRVADLDRLITLGNPVVSPDGAAVAFVVTRVDAEANDYRSQVWLAAVDGSQPPRPFTSGDHKDGNPAWSPDGARLAFTSSRGRDEKTTASLHVAPVATGGEVVTLARFSEGVSGLRWSPDGRSLALTTRTRDQRYDEQDEARRPPMRVTRLFSRLDDVGPVGDRPQHVYVVPADGSAPPRNLTEGPHAFPGPSWSPDSRTIYATGADHDRWDLDLRSDLFAIDVASGERTRLTGTTGERDGAAPSPDGTRVAYVGRDGVEVSPGNGHVGVLTLEGRGESWVTRDVDRTWAPYPDGRSPVWLDDDTLLGSCEDRGSTHLYRISADGSRAPVPLWDGRGVVTGYDAAGGTVAFTVTTSTRPGEVYVLDDDGPRRLTDLTAAFAEAARLREPEHFTVRSTDGTVDLDAWLLTPDGFDDAAAGTWPLLLNIHGGPFTQYAHRFFDEVQMQARAGYVVLWCNPRGSSGREEAFGRAVCGEANGGTGWGSVDYDDVMAVLDATLAERPYVDPDRLGVLGGSYGGYLTSWIVGHNHRFRAAVSERAANNLLTLEAASDAAGAFWTYYGVSHLDAPEVYLRSSPITYVRDITTPLLILHSENDLRCPVEQSDQMFVAMRLLEKDVELVRFQGESHELSRSGSPEHRKQRMRIILDFFDERLRPAAPESTVETATAESARV